MVATKCVAAPQDEKRLSSTCQGDVEPTFVWDVREVKRKQRWKRGIKSRVTYLRESQRCARHARMTAPRRPTPAPGSRRSSRRPPRPRLLQQQRWRKVPPRAQAQTPPRAQAQTPPPRLLQGFLPHSSQLREASGGFPDVSKMRRKIIHRAGSCTVLQRRRGHLDVTT